MSVQSLLLLKLVTLCLKQASKLPQDRATLMVSEVADVIDHAIESQEEVLGLKSTCRHFRNQN